jgi:signal transduction histidine kinase
MVPFRDLPIRRKLMVFITLVSCFSLLAAVFAVVGFEKSLFNQRVIRDLEARADLLGASVVSALDFDDPELAQQYLQTLASSREILSACVYDKSGTIFAAYVRPGTTLAQFPAPQSNRHQTRGRRLELFRRIISDHESIGTVYLEADLRAPAPPLPSLAIPGAVLVFLACGVLAFGLSTLLQRQIASPIMRLADNAQAITVLHDYSVRAIKESNDEIGRLTDAFNEMLVIIAAREQALNAANQGLARELAERKQAEAALQELSQQLETRVAERTAKLRETVAELEHFSYSLTHDLRAPLRAMQSFAGFLEDECQDCARPQSLDYFRRIKEAAQRMDKLIQDALSYSQIIRQGVPVQPVELSKLVRGLIETYPNLQPPQAEINVELQPLSVLGNEAGLTQCFSNLLGNAVKFVAPGGKPQIRVWAEPRDGMIRIWIEDRGIGLPRAGRHHLFGMFHRLNTTYEGTGIGLAIVRKVVERMGGRVGVESEPGQGSQFWVELRPAASART